VTLCVLLWARPGTEAGLIAYEDQVLGIAAGYRGQVLRHECRVHVVPAAWKRHSCSMVRVLAGAA
jgi:hypothetical protein